MASQETETPDAEKLQLTVTWPIAKRESWLHEM